MPDKLIVSNKPPITAAGNNSPAPPPRRFSLLLVEPYFVLRSTVSAVARSVSGIDVQDVPSVESAQHLLKFSTFDGFFIPLGADASGLELVKQIRQGGVASSSTSLVAVTADKCDFDTITQLRQLDVQRILLKPFKVKTILETMAAFSSLAQASSDAGGALEEPGA